MVPLVGRILQVMDERGLIDMPLRVNGLEVRVAPVAPLAMAQNMEEVNAILQYLQMVGPLGAEGQLAIKTGAVVDYLGDKLGVPAAVRNDAAERTLLIEERAAAEQAQMLAMQQMQMQQAAPQPPQGA
jgi:hypothetical protein